VRSGNENENLEHAKDRIMSTTILAGALAAVFVLVCICTLFAFEQTEFRELKAVLAPCVSVLCVLALLRGTTGVPGETLIDTILIPYEALVYSLIFVAVLWLLSLGHRWIRRISRRRYRSQCARPQHQERHAARDEIRHSAIRTEDARGEVER
jgi:uncharacterized membrane protein